MSLKFGGRQKDEDRGVILSGAGSRASQWLTSVEKNEKKDKRMKWND